MHACAIDGIVDGKTLNGWVLDTDNPDTPLEIRIDLVGPGGRQASVTGVADMMRADVGAHYESGGRHGFQIELPADFPDGALSASVRLAASPDEPLATRDGLELRRPVAPPPPPDPYLGDVNGVALGTKLRGWAATKANPAAAVQVRLILGDAVMVAAADQKRADLGRLFGANVMHGFSFDLPVLDAPERRRFEVRHAATDRLLDRGEGTVLLPFRTTADAPSSAEFAIHPEIDQPCILATVSTNRFYRLVFETSQDLPHQVRAGISLSSGGDGQKLKIIDGQSRHPVAPMGLRCERQQTADGYRYVCSFLIDAITSVKSASDVLPGEVGAIDVVLRLFFRAPSDLPDAPPEEIVGRTRLVTASPAFHGFWVRDGSKRLDAQANSALDVPATPAGLIPDPARESFGSLRVVAIGRPSFRAFVARSCEIVQLSGRDRKGEETDWRAFLWSRRFDAILVDAEFALDREGFPFTSPAETRAFTEFCASLDIPVFSVGDPGLEPLDPELGITALPTQRPPLDLASWHPFIPGSDKPLFQPDQLDATPRILDGWWDASAAGAGSDACSDAGDPRVLVVDTRYEVAVNRLTSTASCREAFIGCVDDAAAAALFRLTRAALVPARSIIGESAFAWRLLQSALTACAPIAVGGPLSVSQKAALADLAGAPDAEADYWADVLTAPLGDASIYPKLVLASRIRYRYWSSTRFRDALSEALAEASPNAARRAAAAADDDPEITVLAVTMRPENINNIVANFNRQLYPKKKLIVCLHGDFDEATVRSVRAALDAVKGARFFRYPRRWALGKCINEGAAQADTPFIAKYDDDDFYTDTYLVNVAHHYRITRFEVFTQPHCLIYFEGDNKLCLHWPSLRNGNRIVDRKSYAGFPGAGGTLVFARSLLDTVPFADKRRAGIDSDWVARVVTAGVSVVVGEGLDYIFTRSEDLSGHTWQVEDDYFQNKAILLGSGPTPEAALASLSNASGG